MKWRNIRYDDKRRPVTIVADGEQEGFKTTSPVAARLSPDVVDALVEWSAKVADRLPEANILTIVGHPLTTYNVEDAFESMRKKWKLPKLRPKDLRHWAATTARKAGLSKQATAYLMGHDAAAGGAMRDWYDSPQLADVFDEQSARLPKGLLGILDPPEIKIVDGLPEEAVGLMKAYWDGQMGTMEFSSKMEALRMRQVVKATSVLTP